MKLSCYSVCTKIPFGRNPSMISISAHVYVMGSVVKRLMIAALLTVSITVNASDDDVCTKVDGFIEEFKAVIDHDRATVPKGPHYWQEMEPQSINAFIEESGNIQRTIEFIDQKLNLSNMADGDQRSMKQRMSECPSFQILTQKCKALIQDPQCDPSSPYRTLDGTCNNLKHTRWGSMYSKYRRIFPAHYEGISGFRISVAGDPLPESRNLSLHMLQGGGNSDEKFSQFFMLLGQLLTHEITDAPMPKINGEIPNCCQTDNMTNSWCDPILPDVTDPFYSMFNSTCMVFQRHVPYPSCKFGKRQQMNGVTAFLDCHFVYGRNEVESQKLRDEKDTGRLRVQKSDFGDLSPGNVSQDDQFCFTPERCFFGGDTRVNQHTLLMALHTLFVREHNRMADQLRQLNPLWGGERIFQVARKILGAKMQMITYKEYLPLLLGKNGMKEFGLEVGGPIKNHYDKNLSPNVFHEFATYGFRFHNTVNTKVGKRGCSNMSFKDTNSNPEPLHQGCLRNFLEQSSQVPQLSFDRWIVSDMANFFFRFPGVPYGLDMGAINIKRGREHGMAPYTAIASHVYGKPFESFEDLEDILTSDKIDVLKRNYQNVHDVDPWIGMVMENLIPGAMVGPTAYKLTGEHFQTQKRSDRFYFENQGLPNSFTTESWFLDQIVELRKTTLSRMLCDNIGVRVMLHNPLLIPSLTNPSMPCEHFQDVNMNLWISD